MTIKELIIEAQEALNKVSKHPDFIKLVDKEIWEDPAIVLQDALEAIENLLDLCIEE